MFLRIDKLQVEMPAPTEPDPNAAAAVQECSVVASARCRR
jgi:Mn-containing catalase